GRGITVCKRWHNFLNFLADMGEKPAGLSIERINNDKGYNPSNCKWATSVEQNRNHRGNHNLTIAGVTSPIVVWAERSGVDRRTILSRIRKGWPVRRA